MKETRCENCLYAHILDKPRMVCCGDMVMHQCAGSIVCRCTHITSITITDDGMICSSFKKREAIVDGHHTV